MTSFLEGVSVWAMMTDDCGGWGGVKIADFLMTSFANGPQCRPQCMVQFTLLKLRDEQGKRDASKIKEV